VKGQKIIIIVLSVCFFIFHIIYFYVPKKKGFDSISIGIEAILIFIFVFFFFYEQLKDAKTTPIYDNYFFWVSIGLFFYLGGSFFIYLSATALTNKEMDKYWFFTYVVEIIKNLLFVLAILIYSKNPVKPKSNQALPNLDYML
jgi:hypothetical protein